MSAANSKKAKTPESLPDTGDPERKRVLNVLAQRRYRECACLLAGTVYRVADVIVGQRRREKIAALEAQAKGVTSSSTTSHEVAAQPSTDDSDSLIAHPDFINSAAVESIVNPTAESSFTMFDFDQDPFESGLMAGFHSELTLNQSVLTNNPTPIPSTTSLSPPAFPLTSDGALLDIPALSATRTLLTIATALNVLTHIYDPYYLHILPPSIPTLSALPENLQPVAAQLTIPHHPILDLLPWPSVREKLICMLSMPSALRPPVAQEVDEGVAFHFRVPNASSPSTSNSIKQGSAIVSLVHDLDDYEDGGGLRIHGNSTAWSEGNELLEDAWEIGDHFYRKWWWCLDQKVVDVSNRRRMERGLGRLKMMA
jgi:hypothetical protein